jgi:hypothetical protein
MLVLFPFACGFLILVLLRRSAVFGRLRMLSCSMSCSHILHGCCCLGAALVYTISMFPRSYCCHPGLLTSGFYVPLQLFVLSLSHLCSLRPSFPWALELLGWVSLLLSAFLSFFPLPLACCVLVKLVAAVLLSSSGLLPASST